MLKLVFLYIVYALIKIGDFVILLFNKLSSPFETRKRKTKRKALSAKSKTIEIYINKKQAYIYKGKRVFFRNLFKKIFFNLKSIRNLTGKLFFPFNFSAKRKRKNHKKASAFAQPLLSKIKFFSLGIIFAFFFIFLPLLGLIYISNLPDLQDLTPNAIPKTTKIYDRNDNLLYEIYANQNRTVVKLSEIPMSLREATIAIEDRNFYGHPGFDLKGMIRAAVTNFRKQGFQGGSTITQQLVKSAFLTPEPTFTRKIKEVVLAFLAERIYSKNKILELYFNYVPYGGTAWGVQAASEIYFNKDVKDLDLAESAFLAGIPRAPTLYSPFINKNNLWKKRQKEVLDAMVNEGYISKAQANEAYKEELKFNDPQVPIKAPHFVMYIRDLLIQKYGLNQVERGGLQVKTSLDLNTQEMAENTVRQEVESDAYLNIKNGAALVTNPATGEILAMVGNANYFDQANGGNVNVTTSLRQPGSSIKIVTYTLALSQGFTEATILDDSPLTIVNPWGAAYTPVNYDGKFHGKVPLRLAFANSFNIPAVRTAQKVGVENIVNFGQQMGIRSWNNNPKSYGVSITLGSADTTMLDMATVYGTVANGGKRVDLNPITEVSDSDGNVLYKKSVESKQIVDPGVAFIISDILADNNARSIEFGLNSPLYIPGHRVSVKTGTSDNKRDNWTIGFTKNYVVAAWVGNNDNTPMSQDLASGITGAAPIWNKIMTNLLENSKDSPVSIPPNVIMKPCYGKQAYFVRGTERSVNCNIPTATPSATITPR